MNTEEQKKKELEKRGEDDPQTGRPFPDSSMTKDQRKDAERVNNDQAEDTGGAASEADEAIK